MSKVKAQPWHAGDFTAVKLIMMFRINRIYRVPVDKCLKSIY
jgi:hypothetical protein